MPERVVTTVKMQEPKEKCPNSCRQKSDFHSSGSSAERILQLQRTVGNQAVQKLIKSGVLQTKFRVGQPSRSQAGAHTENSSLTATSLVSKPGKNNTITEGEPDKEVSLTHPKDIINHETVSEIEDIPKNPFESLINNATKVTQANADKKSTFSISQSKKQESTGLTSRSQEVIGEKDAETKGEGTKGEVKKALTKAEESDQVSAQVGNISPTGEIGEYSPVQEASTIKSSEQKQQVSQSLPGVITPIGLPSKEFSSKEATKSTTKSTVSTDKEIEETVTKYVPAELSALSPSESLHQKGETAGSSSPSTTISTLGEGGGSSEEQAEAEKTKEKMAEASMEDESEGEEIEEVEPYSSPEITMSPSSTPEGIESPPTSSTTTPISADEVAGDADTSEGSSAKMETLSEEPAEVENTEVQNKEKSEISTSVTAVSGGELAPAERDAAMSSLAEGSRGEASISGGGGSGTAIEEKAELPAPDVSGADPSQALAVISSLPPAKMAAAFGDVSSSVSRAVGEQREELVTNPPTMERPIGAPATRQTELTDSLPVSSGEKGRPVERVPEGEAKPVPQPQPLLPAPAPPTQSVPQPQIQSSSESQMSSSDVAAVQASLRQLPTTDPGLEVTVGSPPSLNMEGNADPARIQEQKGKLNQSIAEAKFQGKLDSSQSMGENEIYPKVPQEILRSQIKSHGSGNSTGGIAGGTSKGATLSNRGDKEEAASIIAHEQHGAEIQAAIATAQKDMAVKRQEHSKRVSQEQSKSRAEIAQLETENSNTQVKEREKAWADVQGLRLDWIKEQQTVVDQSNQEADRAKQQANAVITREQEQGEAQAAKHIEEGNKEASEARSVAEKKAIQIRKQGEKESSGFFSWLASKAKEFVNRIKNEIKTEFEKARAFVRGTIEKAKKLATQVLEKARQQIVAAICKVGDVLIAIGDRLLANFPKLRDRFRKEIKDRVSEAEATVNKLADRLKKDVQKSLDLLGAGIDASLGLMEKGMLAAVSIAGKVVQGVIKVGQAVVNTVAAFASLIKDIAAGPGRWIRNLGAAIMDGIRNHLWKALKAAVMNWFNQKLEEVLGLGTMVWNLLKKGGIAIGEIGKMVWEALKSAIPIALIQILIEKLISMIVPAAGAVMAIIEGLRAAWGTVSRIIQSFGLFFTFLKAVKTGNAGSQFAAALAAAAIVVIDFVANWLLRRLRKPAGKVAGKLKGIAQRIGQKVKKAAKKVAAKVKGVIAKVKTKFNKFTDRFRKQKKVKEQRPKKSKREKDQDRLNKVVKELRPKIVSLIKNGVSQLRLTVQLAYWRAKYRLTRLEVKGNGENASVFATINPGDEVVQIVRKHGALLHALMREIGREILKTDATINSILEEEIIKERAAGKGKDPEDPLVLPVGSFLVQAADISSFIPHPTNPRPGTFRTPGYTEHLSYAGVRHSERQTFGYGPGHITTLFYDPLNKGEKREKGNYSSILSQLEAIKKSTNVTDAELALKLRVFRETGVLDPKLENYKMKLAAYNRLLFGVEMGRMPAQVPLGTMLDDALVEGRMTTQQTLELSPATLPGAVRTSTGIGNDQDRPYANKPDPHMMEEMKRRELEIIVNLLYSKWQIEDPWFETMEQLERLIRNDLKDMIKSGSKLGSFSSIRR